MPPLRTPAARAANYHDKNRYVVDASVSRSHDAPGRYRGRLREEMMPAMLQPVKKIQKIDDYGGFGGSRGAENERIKEKLSVQEQIKLINEKNAAGLLAKGTERKMLLGGGLGRLPPLAAVEGENRAGRLPLILSRDIGNIEPQKQRDFLKAPEWWG